ncbi:IS5 family transposase [Lacticaseibacillus camelliae DSM 22697 = JCM 13995]|uniref:IS5 family transposase n=1 Tax=Lacticaseibacillus camelliae DSM 22697 = JCM 13995 TaxID=1423730 RepID=A0A0R2F9Z4_9LACO|nr:IS5 family transposase [Lacticaseibacillus camelliae DSM 22697 = JCM 13995]
MAYRHSPLQLSFASFGAALSTPLSSDNEWVQLADIMPWKALDEAYQLEFTKNTGRAAKPFRLLYGASLIPQRMGLTDRGVVAAICDTPALQYFVGLSEYKAVAPFSYSSLTHFRKRSADISALITDIINDTVRAKIEALVPFKVDTVITDATAVPIKIKYPQDTVLLNQARLNRPDWLNHTRPKIDQSTA